MKIKLPHIALMLPLALLAGCHNDPPVVAPRAAQHDQLKEHMINANKTIAQAEQTSIDEYVARRGWPVRELSNGARLWEYEAGKGAQVDYEDSVHLRYDIEAINGTRLYSNLEEDCVAGRRREMVGLDEAVRQLHFGSRAKVILPSNLAYGIGGDGDRIPSSAVLVLDVEVSPVN